MKHYLMLLHLTRKVPLLMRNIPTIVDGAEAPSGPGEQPHGAEVASRSDSLPRASTSISVGPAIAAGIDGFRAFESRGGLVANEQIDRLREQDVY